MTVVYEVLPLSLHQAIEYSRGWYQVLYYLQHLFRSNPLQSVPGRTWSSLSRMELQESEMLSGGKEL